MPVRHCHRKYNSATADVSIHHYQCVQHIDDRGNGKRQPLHSTPHHHLRRRSHAKTTVCLLLVNVSSTMLHFHLAVCVRERSHQAFNLLPLPSQRNNDTSTTTTTTTTTTNDDDDDDDDDERRRRRTTTNDDERRTTTTNDDDGGNNNDD